MRYLLIGVASVLAVIVGPVRAQAPPPGTYQAQLPQAGYPNPTPYWRYNAPTSGGCLSRRFYKPLAIRTDRRSAAGGSARPEPEWKQGRRPRFLIGPGGGEEATKAREAEADLGQLRATAQGAASAATLPRSRLAGASDRNEDVNSGGPPLGCGVAPISQEWQRRCERRLPGPAPPWPGAARASGWSCQPRFAGGRGSPYRVWA